MSNTSNIPISHYKVLSLPSVLEPNSVYYVLDQNTFVVEGYITSKYGVPIPLFNGTSKGGDNISELVNDVGYITLADIPSSIGKSKVFNEVPFGDVNGANAIFTSQFNFIPETLSVFLNGMLQKIISDYNTSLNNTINLVNSPESTEHILINYTKQ